MARALGANYCRNGGKCVTLHRGKDKARRILTRSAEKIFSLGREKKWSIKKGGAFFDILNNIQHSTLNIQHSTLTIRFQTRSGRRRRVASGAGRRGHRAKSDSSLADLYDPTLMPRELLQAHRQNDRLVMQAYGFTTKMTESECVAELFRRYGDMAK